MLSAVAPVALPPCTSSAPAPLPRTPDWRARLASNRGFEAQLSRRVVPDSPAPTDHVRHAAAHVDHSTSGAMLMMLLLGTARLDRAFEGGDDRSRVLLTKLLFLGQAAQPCPRTRTGWSRGRRSHNRWEPQLAYFFRLKN